MIIIATSRTAAFNSPNKGDRIELPNKPGEYYYVPEKPQSGKDPRGMPFWSGNLMDPSGKSQFMSSDQISSWKHFPGPNYQWHDEMIEKQKQDAKRQQQQQLVSAFEKQYAFPDGQVLRERMPPMMVRVNRDAPGDLAVFSMEPMAVKGIDYQKQTVSLEPVGEGLEEFSGVLSAVPAAEVVQFTAPAVPKAVTDKPVKLTDGTSVPQEQALGMTPLFNKKVRDGQVNAKTQTYLNYSGGKGTERYVKEMAGMGMEAQEGQHYSVNATPAQFDAAGRQTTPLGAWQATLTIAPPITDELRNEIRTFAPESQINESRNGIRVHSNALYRNMVLLGHFAQQTVA